MKCLKSQCLLHRKKAKLNPKAEPEDPEPAGADGAPIYVAVKGVAALLRLRNQPALTARATFTARTVLSQFDPTYTTPSSSTAGDEEISLSPTE